MRAVSVKMEAVVEVPTEEGVGVDGVGAGGRIRCIEYSVDYIESVKGFPPQ